MATRQTAQRQRPSRTKSIGRVIRLQLKDNLGNPRWVTADLLDVSGNGMGLSTRTPLTAGSKIVVRGNLGDHRTDVVSPALVKWCTEKINGNFHAGLELGEGSSAATEGAQSSSTATEDAPTSPPATTEAQDFYEVMQLSPNADTDTVTRVYRVLAQRYHPDSPKTGNQEMFLRLCEAHRTLSDPELRAKYDAGYNETKRLRWKIFDRPEASKGAEGERRKRQGILHLLYAKTLHDPERASMGLFEFEELLGCPREHLQTALWYLRGKGYLRRADNGRFEITVAGFDEVENNPQPEDKHGQTLLESGDPVQPSGQPSH
ncbi:MAG TPA: DnaJ domain-containing protein [Bryobacteraceae bacterium]|nr:DnaJ domain-containing protein [Bryobacteraceae bacterium]